MAEDRPPPKGSEPGTRDDDSVPRHRVVWDHGPLGPPTPAAAQRPVSASSTTDRPDRANGPERHDSDPVRPPMGRGTVRMVRPNLSGRSLDWIHTAKGPDSLEERPVNSVVDMAPTTERVPQAPARPTPQSTAPPPSVVGVGYGPPPQAQGPSPGQAQGQAAGQGPYGAPPAQTAGHALARTAAMLPSPGTPMPLARPIPQPAPPRVTSRTIDPRLVMLTDPDSARAAGFRRLRDNLLTKGLPRVLAVSSASQHEGKTTCAMNLALALAEHTPARILLVDGNFFQPSLAGIFSIDEATPAAPAVDAWLAPYRFAELTPCLHVAAMVLRRGEAPPRFDKHRFDMLLDRLCRIGYDHLIIDAPAIEGSPMVSQLLGGVDGVLLAVRSGITTARELRRAIEEIPGNKAIGVALMDADPQS